MQTTERSIYQKWVEYHAYRAFFIALSISLAAMVAFGLLDYINFEEQHAQQFSSGRLALVLFLILLGVYAVFVKSRCKDPERMRRIFTGLLYLPPIAVNFLHLYFCVYALSYPEIQRDVLIGSVTACFITYMVLGKFIYHQLAFFISSVASVTLAQYLLLDNALLVDIVWSHVLASMVSVVINRRIGEQVYDKFLNFKKIVPVKCAHELAVTGKKLEDIEESKPVERFTAFLVCDWRSYQELAQHIKSERLSRLFRDVYTLAFSKLPEVCPEMTYYTSWTADEHRVTFYSNTQSEDDVRLMAIRYAEFLRNELPLLIRTRLDVTIEYDIGVSSGYALTGLQGPPDAVQYTISGDHPGVAKRLESEAAYYRNQIKKTSPSQPLLKPIIIMTEDFTRALEKCGLYSQYVQARSKSQDTLGLGIVIDFGGLSAQQERAVITDSSPNVLIFKKIRQQATD